MGTEFAAFHLYYLLKGDEEDLRQLWSALTGSEGLHPAVDLSLAEEPEGFCRVINRVESEAAGVCLIALPDLSLIEVGYPAGGGDLATRWREARAAIEADRVRLTGQTRSVFGETTLLAAPAGTSPGEISEAAGLRGRPLAAGLNLDGAGPRTVLLLHFPEQPDSRDYYAVAADDPAAFADRAFPGMDSLIKRLSRTASYFEQQRQTIASERAEVDLEVGSILHRQVMGGAARQPAGTPEAAGGGGAGGAGEPAGAAALEEQITGLSRIFGVLATDSLLVRQSSDSIKQDVKQLGLEFERLGAQPGPANEIGEYYLARFGGDLAEAEAERRNLDFARQNAQAAIEVVRTQVEILRAGEEAAIQQQSQEILSRSLILQKERLALQVAAGFIEFVLVYYYVLKSWEGIAGTEAFDRMSALVRALAVGAFAGSAAIGTHYLARVLQRESWKTAGFWISAAVLVSATAVMVMLTIVYES